MGTHSKSAKKKLALVLLATAAVGLAFVLVKARKVDVESTAAAVDIEARLNDLDAATRAATLTKVAAEGL